MTFFLERPIYVVEIIYDLRKFLPNYKYFNLYNCFSFILQFALSKAKLFKNGRLDRFLVRWHNRLVVWAFLFTNFSVAVEKRR